MRLFLIIFLLFSFTLHAQQFNIDGISLDKSDSSAIPGVSVILKNKNDSSQIKATITNENGNFSFENIDAGEYILEGLLMGYKEFSRNIQVPGKRNFYKIKLTPDTKTLNTVDVNAIQDRVTLKGDTAEINAGSYKVNTDATVEDLVKKMPGITSENGTIKAQGEEVKKVLIDGKEFFGDDANAALKNLPAEIVEKIQVFDKLSDQAQFTGFNDGNTTKTLNIVTKRGMSNGEFGKFYAGAGTDERFNSGLNYNHFSGNQKITVLGMFNNINQQNFSAQDLIGVAQSSSGGGGGGGRRGGGGMGRGGMQVDPTANFMSAQQSGISTTGSGGINYVNQWGKKLKFTGSYFYNSTQNENTSLTLRTYFLSRNGNQNYNETALSEIYNQNHRINVRAEFSPDTMNTIFFTPQFSFQNNTSENTSNGLNTIKSIDTLNKFTNKLNNENLAYNGKANLLWMHRFIKPRRTISIDAGFSINDKTTSSKLISRSTYFDQANDSVVNLNQLTNQLVNGLTYSSSITFTEPFKQNGQFYLSYAPSISYSLSDKKTNAIDSLTGDYNSINSVLSNTFDNNLITHRPGTGFRIRTEKLMINVGADYQSLNLAGAQTFPLNSSVNKNFIALLPKVMTRISFSKTKEMRLFYTTSAQAPSVTQLQNVIDNSNPLNLSSGNPGLKQQYIHNIVYRFNSTWPESGKSLFVLINGTANQNYITNKTTIAFKDTLLTNGVFLQRGAQLSSPVNLNDNYAVRSMITYSLPLSKIKCNISINSGVNYLYSPALINQTINYSTTWNYNAGLVLSSNISEKIDFSVSYTSNYNDVKNSIQQSANNNYYIGLTALKLTIMHWKGLLIGSDFTHYQFQGLSGQFNQQIPLWGGSIGYKFLKNRAAEFKISVFDLLTRNNSITRNVTESYVEDLQNSALRKYILFTFTYNLKKFGEKEQKK